MYTHLPERLYPHIDGRTDERTDGGKRRTNEKIEFLSLFSPPDNMKTGKGLKQDEKKRSTQINSEVKHRWPFCVWVVRCIRGAFALVTPLYPETFEGRNLKGWSHLFFWSFFSGFFIFLHGRWLCSRLDTHTNSGCSLHIDRARWNTLRSSSAFPTISTTATDSFPPRPDSMTQLIPWCDPFPRHPIGPVRSDTLSYLKPFSFHYSPRLTPFQIPDKLSRL